MSHEAERRLLKVVRWQPVVRVADVDFEEAPGELGDATQFRFVLGVSGVSISMRDRLTLQARTGEMNHSNNSGTATNSRDGSMVAMSPPTSTAKTDVGHMVLIN